MGNIVTGGFRGGGGGLTTAQRAVLDLLSASGGELTVSGDLAVTGSAPSGLTMGEQAVLDALSVSSGRIIATRPVLWKPQSVADWSALPAGWSPLSPVAASALTASASHAAGGMTLSADVAQYMLHDTSFQSTPAGVFTLVDPAIGSLDLTLTVDSFAFHGRLSTGYGYVGISLMSTVMGELGGRCSARIYYAQAGSPYYLARKSHKRPNDRAQAESDATTVQSASGDPGEQTIRLVLANNLRTYQAYWGETEMGGGSVATGAVDWTRNDTDPTYDTWGTGPLAVVIEMGTSAASSPASTVRITGLTVA